MNEDKLNTNTPFRAKKEDSLGKRCIIFHIVVVDTCYPSSSQKKFYLKNGPHFVNDAPSSDIGEHELHLIRSKQRTDYTGMYEDLCVDVAHHPYW